MVMKPVMARTFGFGRSSARNPGKANEIKTMNADRMHFGAIVLAYAVSTALT
jgi:hypothetical protein